ncbi:MAG: hypothetical protein BroJett014_15990 [Planctomycetota bacterium]|nr:MAG: hypothetical protein BroJett014_15990 [Planctomycetota bacterium]
MLLAMDIGDWLTLLFVAGVVVVSLIMRSRTQQAQGRPAPRRAARDSVPPTRQRQRLPAPAAASPAAAAEDEDSDEAVAVAQELAPDYIEVANATRLADLDRGAAVEPAMPALNLRNVAEVRRAVIMQEILGKPRALRRRS